MEKREFGFRRFGQEGMVRHLQFKDMKELLAVLVREVPSDVYCSNALYERPAEQDMKSKEWISADLIFDVDAKDLIPATLESAKLEVQKLLVLLELDFGIDRNGIELYFSGNNGFHVHVKDPEYATLDSPARAELVDYIRTDSKSENFKNKLTQISAVVDSQVTTDIHRIFRMPFTINSKAGMVKCRITDLEAFDPKIHAGIT